MYQYQHCSRELWVEGSSCRARPLTGWIQDVEGPRCLEGEVRSTGEVLLGALRRVAGRPKASMSQVAIVRLVAKGAVPVVGFRRKKHVEEAVDTAKLQNRP